MRQQRRHAAKKVTKRRRALKWPLLIGAGLLILAAVILFLIFRGAKVQGPTETSKASSATQTTTSLARGTYTAKGDVVNANGNTRTIRVYLKLSKKHKYTRMLIDETSKARKVTVDSGTYKSSGRTVTLTSTKAVVAHYSSNAKFKEASATKLTKYLDGASEYTDNMTNVLDNTVTTNKRVPTTYHYLDDSLTLKKSSKVLTSVAVFADTQAVTAATTSSKSSSEQSESSSTSSVQQRSSQQTQQSNSTSSSSSYTPTGNQIQAVRDRLSSEGIDGNQFTDNEISTVLIRTNGDTASAAAQFKSQADAQSSSKAAASSSAAASSAAASRAAAEASSRAAASSSSSTEH